MNQQPELLPEGEILNGYANQAAANAARFAAKVKSAVFIRDLLTRKMAAKHPAYLAAYAFGLDLAPFHWEWFEWVLNSDRGVLKAARGHGKSTIFSVITPLWQVGNNRNLRIAIVSATAGQSEKFLREIGHHIEKNDRYRLVFGDLRDPDAVWTQRQKTVERPKALKDATFLAIGVGSGFAGARTDQILMDDIVDESNSLTVHRRRRVLNWILETAMPTLDPTGPQRALMIGTPYHFDDALTHLAMVWPSREYPAINEQGEILWPERFTADELERRRKEGGEYRFATQYLVRPVGLEGNRLQRKWLRESPDTSPHELEVLGIDWAVVPEDEAELHDRDYTGLTFYRATPWGLELYDCEQFQMALPDVIDYLLHVLAERPAIQLIGAEQNGVGRPAIDWLRRVTALPLVPIMSQGTKISRMELMAPEFAAGRITLATERTERVNQFVHQWTSFPFGQHDDLLDAADIGRKAYGIGGGVTVGMAEG